MKRNQPQDLGSQINRALQNALNSRDFTELKQIINTTAQDVRQGVNSVLQGMDAGRQSPIYTTAAPADAGASPSVKPGKIRRKLPGKASSILRIVFGLIGAIPLGIAVLVLTIVGLALWTGELLLPWGICLALFLPCSGLAQGGFRTRRRLKRFQRYQEIISGASYYDLRQLAAATAQSKRSLVRDLKWMMRQGLFAEAWLDAGENTLILDPETYRLYRSMETARQQSEPEKEAPKAGAESAVEQVLSEGRSYIRQIRSANDAIPDAAVSDKLFRLEEITSRIFAYVEAHPEKQSGIRKFIGYYLPTTLKLVNAYREFDRSAVQGENVTRAKQEIAEVLDTINAAFQSLLESLYEDDVMDISADISALGTILRQDGLTDDGMKPV